MKNSNYGLLKESYRVVVGTKALLTTEVDANGIHRKSFWQFRSKKEEKCLIQFSLIYTEKEKLLRPLTQVLINKVLRSIKLKTELKTEK